MPGVAAAQEDQTVYRIELLIIRHLDSSQEPDYIAELPPLPDTLDVIERARIANEGKSEEQDPLAITPPDSSLLPPAGPFPDDQGPWSEVVWLETLGEQMSAVWRNLRLSGEFRPETYLSWEQPGDPPFPLMRVRNDQVIRIDDPFEGQRAAGTRYIFSYDLPEGHFGLMPLPEPEYEYALEGRVQLRRSRFLHFDLDLSLRQPAPDAALAIAGPPLRPEYLGYQVYRLQQSRQIRTARLEYFDSPVLSALLWVTEIEVEDEELTP